MEITEKAQKFLLSEAKRHKNPVIVVYIDWNGANKAELVDKSEIQEDPGFEYKKNENLDFPLYFDNRLDLQWGFSRVDLLQGKLAFV